MIPTRNEGRGLRRVLPALPAVVDEIVIVDGDWSDGTLEVAAQLRPDSVRLRQHGRGKGGAIKQGLLAATGDILVTMDGDGSMDPADIDLAVGELCRRVPTSSRAPRALPGAGSADFTSLRRHGNGVLARVANLLYGQQWTDITYGFNAYWRGVIVELDDLADGFEFEIQAALKAARAGLAVSEVPCVGRRRGSVESRSPSGSGPTRSFRILVSGGASPPRARFRSVSDLYLQ